MSTSPGPTIHTASPPRIVTIALHGSGQVPPKASITSRLERLRESTELERGVRLYNAAIENVNRRDVAGAIAILDQLLATATDTQLVAAAKEMRDRLTLAPLATKK